MFAIFESFVVKLSKMDSIFINHLSELDLIYYIEKVCKSNNYLWKTAKIN